jgi:solute carrier family 25 aspartate/glutamate transporter 12/13
VIRKTELYRKVPFKLDGPFTELYFGRERSRAINYSEFSQFLHGEFYDTYSFGISLNFSFRFS